MADIEQENGECRGGPGSGRPDNREGGGGNGPRGDHDAAEEMVYDAYEAPTRRQMIQMARQALQISPDCAKAYVLLAYEDAETPEEKLELYKKGVEAGERALGPETFEEYQGEFWGRVKTRPYMRARFGLAQALWKLGERQQAIRHAKHLLKLNPKDHQGVRTVLVMWLAALDRNHELGRVLEDYGRGGTIEMVLADAIWRFRTEGVSETATERLRTAFEANPHISQFLLGDKAIPDQRPTEGWALGSETEAAEIARLLTIVFDRDEGTADWVCDELERMDQ